MNIHRHTVLLALALALALLAPGVARAQGEHEGHAAESGDEQMSESAMAMMESIEELRELSGRELEVGYVNRIIPHHEGALEMAEMVVDAAPHREVREAAARIIEDQKREIEQLTTFQREELGAELDRDERQAMDHGMMMPMHEDPGSESAEKLFLLMMREHHQTAVEMGEIVLERAESEALLDQARGMVESQRAEQEQFAEWLKEWYDVEAPEPTGDMMAAAELAVGADMPEAGAGGLSGSGGGSALLPASLLAGLAALVVAYGARRRIA